MSHMNPMNPISHINLVNLINPINLFVLAKQYDKIYKKSCISFRILCNCIHVDSHRLSKKVLLTDPQGAHPIPSQAAMRCSILPMPWPIRLLMWRSRLLLPWVHLWHPAVRHVWDWHPHRFLGAWASCYSASWCRIHGFVWKLCGPDALCPHWIPWPKLRVTLFHPPWPHVSPCLSSLLVSWLNFLPPRLLGQFVVG